MMVNTKHVFSATVGGRIYQVIDNEENDIKSVHRYMVMEWDKSLFQNGARLVAQDVSIYATSKLDAINKYREKYKKAK